MTLNCTCWIKGVTEDQLWACPTKKKKKQNKTNKQKKPADLKSLGPVNGG